MKRILFWSAIFIVGLLLGASLTAALIGGQIDLLHMENITLQESLAAMDEQIQHLQEKPKKRIISRIDAKVMFNDDSDFDDFEEGTIQLTVEKNIREWLAAIIGQGVNEVDYLLIPQIIDNRDIEINGKKIRLAIRMVVISDIVTVYVITQKVPSDL